MQRAEGSSTSIQSIGIPKPLEFLQSVVQGFPPSCHVSYPTAGIKTTLVGQVPSAQTLLCASVDNVFSNAVQANNPTAGLQKGMFEGSKWNLVPTIQPPKDDVLPLHHTRVVASPLTFLNRLDRHNRPAHFQPRTAEFELIDF